MRRARRVDANLSGIVQAYRALGCKVHVTNAAWDLTVQYGGVTDCVEVKDGSKSPSRRKLTPAEQKLHDILMIRIVLGLDQVKDHVAALRNKAHTLMTSLR